MFDGPEDVCFCFETQIIFLIWCCVLKTTDQNFYYIHSTWVFRARLQKFVVLQILKHVQCLCFICLNR